MGAPREHGEQGSIKLGDIQVLEELKYPNLLSGPPTRSSSTNGEDVYGYRRYVDLRSRLTV